MKKLLLATLLTISAQSAFAYTPFPLSLEWFGSAYQSISENDQKVWRGKIIEVMNSTEVVIQNINGHKTQVKLLHLSPPTVNNERTIRVMTNALTSLIGNSVYVLGDEDKDKIVARLIDRKGLDINLELVRSGAFDINTTSLMMKKSKKAYLAGVKTSQNQQRGIWFNL